MHLGKYRPVSKQVEFRRSLGKPRGIAL